MTGPIDPTKVYQINNGDTSKLLSFPKRLGVGNDSQVIPAVTGRRILVMGWKIQSSAAIGSFQFKSASGGTLLTPVFTSPPNTNGATNDLPVIPNGPGYFETNTGEGLFVDVFTAAQEFLIFYITYKP